LKEDTLISILDKVNHIVNFLHPSVKAYGLKLAQEIKEDLKLLE